MTKGNIEPEIEMIYNEEDINGYPNDSSFVEKKTSPQDDDSLNCTLNIYKNFRIRIYKPLIPLKLALFLYYGAGSFVFNFLTIYFKQRGITLSELSTFLALAPIFQFMGTVLSGIAADKTGRPKTMLVINLILCLSLLGGIMLVPPLTPPNCDSQIINLKCHPKQFDRLITKTSCDVAEEVIEIKSCNVQCPENVTEHCTGQNLICEMLEGNEERRNFSLSIHVEGSYKAKDRCFYNVSSMYHENATYSWCNVPHKMSCRVSCFVDSGMDCSENSERYTLLMIAMVLYILWMVSYSNCYRFLDVTTMCLVKEHDSFFGRERFFGISGILVVSPIAGLIVGSSSSEGSDSNQLPAFYFFIALLLLVLCVCYKLDVRFSSPGRKMLKKTAYLLKNWDVIFFIIIIFVLGTAFSFTKVYMFWYLEDMNASSFLVGLIPAVSSLYGLPFLVTSKWWVKKIGATQMFVLGLLAYTVNSIGYSFLRDPWYALILESTNILTYHLLWVSVIEYSHDLAPKGLVATVISTAGSIHYQIGKCSGSLIGKFVMNTFNGIVAFRVVAVICFTFAVLYAIYLYVKRTCYSVKHIPQPEGQTQGGIENDEFIMKNQT